MKRIALHGLALLLIAAFVALGFWQLGRERQKREQLASAAAALAAPATPLAQALAQDTTAEFGGEMATVRRVAGDADFVAIPPLWLDNQRRGDRVGVRQYCVAVVHGGALLVDLGWLPLSGDRQLPDVGCPKGVHALAGLLTPPPSVGLALGPGIVEQPDGSILATRLELGAVREKLDLHRFASTDVTPLLSDAVLRLDPATPLGFERDLALLANTLPPEKHRGYALQWFGLAAALVVIVLVLNFRRKPQS